MKIKPRVDSRDFSLHTYGQVAGFIDEFDVDSPVVNDIQESGNVACTAYMCGGIGEDKDKIGYQVPDLFDRVPKNTQGADPKATIKETINGGLLPYGGTIRFKPFNSYFTAHTGDRYDFFDNCRSSLLVTKYSIGLWGKWYSNWGVGNIMETGGFFTNYHAVKCTGWKQINGEPHLVIDAFVGRPLHINRKNFNEWASSYGFGSVVLSTAEINERRDKLLKEKINDLMVNVIIILQQWKAQLLGQLTKKQSVGNIPTLYDVAYSLLGKHLTLDNTVDKNVGCGQAVSYVLKKYGCLIPNKGLAGTSSLNDWLRVNATEVGKPDVGCIIVSVTGTGNESRRGHIGVVGKWQIMSNNSITGLWDTQWTMDEWIQYYETEGGLDTHYYKI
jgi:hypothetical protein